MPHFHLLTNVDQSKFDEQFIKDMTKTLSELVGKPEMYFMITVQGNQFMSFGGSMDPTACVKLDSIGKIDFVNNSKYSTAFFKVLEDKGIPKDRVYLTYENLSPDMIAYNGKLFSDK